MDARFDSVLQDMADDIYSIVDGADHKQHRAKVTQEIFEWLKNGDWEHVAERTATQLAAEWQEYTNVQ